MSRLHDQLTALVAIWKINEAEDERPTDESRDVWEVCIRDAEELLAEEQRAVERDSDSVCPGVSDEDFAKGHPNARQLHDFRPDPRGGGHCGFCGYGHK